MTWMPLQDGQGVGVWVWGPHRALLPLLGAQAVLPTCDRAAGAVLQCPTFRGDMWLLLQDLMINQPKFGGGRLRFGAEIVSLLPLQELGWAWLALLGFHLSRGAAGSRGRCSGLSHVMWPFPGPGQPTPRLGEDSGPWQSQGQLEGLKDSWNCF